MSKSNFQNQNRNVTQGQNADEEKESLDEEESSDEEEEESLDVEMFKSGEKDPDMSEEEPKKTLPPLSPEELAILNRAGAGNQLFDANASDDNKSESKVPRFRR